MKLNLLKLYQFKNHQGFEMKLKNKVIGIHGLNGSGKTNVLDAIYFLCVGKSYFSATDLQCISYGQTQASIIGELENKHASSLKLVIQKGKRKVLECDGKKYTKLTEHLGKFHAVIISPSDISLIYGDNADRRKFIDQTLGQTDSEYLDHLVKYRKWIQQRNAHLKQDRVDHSLLDILDKQIGPTAELLFAKRAQFIEGFIERVLHFYKQMADGREKVGMSYRSSLADKDYLQSSSESRQRDVLLRRSSVGVHKDEIDFTIHDEALKRNGSQGQIKSYLIALKLAQFEHFAKCAGHKPLLLLDDIFEKIDDQRANSLTSIIKSGNFGQIFVTDTHEKRLEQFCASIDVDYQLVAL